MKRVSSVWKVVPGVKRMLDAAEFPPIPQNPKGVKVEMGAKLPSPGSELVVVTGTAPRPIEPFVTAGTPGKDDPHNVIVRVYTNVPGFTEEQAWERLEALGTVVEETFRELERGKPIISDELREAGVWNLTATVTQTSVFPAGDAGGNGYLGEAEITVTTSARI